MQAGHFVAGGDVRVGVVEEGGGIESVRTPMEIGAAVESVGAGGGAHVNVGAAGGTLLGVVHGSVHPKLFDRLRSGRGESLADGEIGGSGALQRFGSGAGDACGAADAGVVDDAGRGHLAGAFAVEEIAGVDAVEEESVAGVALAV